MESVGANTLDVVIGAGELWFPIKELNDVMNEVIRDSQPSEQLIQDVDRVLTRHAADFASLFMINPPSPVDRAELQKCCTEGRYLKGAQEKHVIAYPIVNEVILLSDMFHINEFLALDLLTTAENEQDNYPNWPRGLVAVYMFYQSRVWLICALCTLIRCSPGRQWVSQFHPQILFSFQRVLSSVISDDLIHRMITLLETFSPKNQMQLLERNLALGDSHHRHKVTSLLHQINETLAQTIFCYAGQMSLRWEELALILDYLKVQVNPKEMRVSKGDTILIATVLYSVETTLTPPDVDMAFGESFRKYLKDHKDGGFKCMELCDLFKLSFLIAAHRLPSRSSGEETLQPLSEDLSNELNPGCHSDLSDIPNNTPQMPNESGDDGPPMLALLGDESGDMEFTRNVFGFIQTEIFARPTNYTWDSDICKIFHGLFVDFIVYMPLKLKEIKYRSEEAAKTLLMCQDQNMPTPAAPAVQEYESFLECLGEFYEHDPFELGRYYFLEDSQYLPLSKLVRMCCLESASLFSSCMRFLSGVSTGNPASLFQLLRQSDHNASLEHFFESVTRYVQNFMTQPIAVSMLINPMEVQSICSYLRLIQVLCINNESIRKFFTSQKPSWFRSALHVVKIRKFPREVRTTMLDTCAAMIGEDSMSPGVVSTLWNIFYNTNLIDPGSWDLQMELNEEEIGLQDYSLTIGLLSLLQALIKSRFPTVDYISLESNTVHPTDDNGAILRYITFVVDAVFLKVPYLPFKNVNQRWRMIKLCADILSILLDYLPRLMIELLRDSPLIRTVLNSIVECTLTVERIDCRDDEMDSLLSNEVKSCSLSLLTLLWRTLQRQQFYLINKRQLLNKQEADGVLLLGIHEIMINTSNQGGAAHNYILSIIRFVDLLFSSPTHVRTALEILSILLEGHTEIDHMIHHQLVQQMKVAKVFRHTVVELLYSMQDSIDVQNSIMSALKLIRSSVIHEDPNVGMLLLSFDAKNGKFTGARTVVHALMDNAAVIPTSFMTLLTILKDSRMNQTTLKLLRYSRFFQGYLRQNGILSELSFEGLAYFLKCLAVELKLEEGLDHVALDLVGSSFERLEEILNIIHMDNLVEVPNLEFFDVALVTQAIEHCEFVDEELKIKLVRVEKLEGLLKSDIGKLAKNTTLGFRKSVHSEAKDIVDFARKLNQSRCREGCKLMVFDGWRQVVEVMVLNPLLHQQHPVFCSSVLRILLSKVVEGGKEMNLNEYFLRIAAETVLILCAVMTSGAAGSERGFEVSGAALNVVIHNLCTWVQSSQNGNVRGILYASLLYCVNMLGDAAERVGFASEMLQSSQNAFPMILHNLCRDCCQGAGERTRMHALYLMGEIIKCTTQRGFGGPGELFGEEMFERSDHQLQRELGSKEDPKSTLKFSLDDETSQGKSQMSQVPRSGSSSLPWSLPNETAVSVFGETNDKESKSFKGTQVRGVDRTIMNCVFTNGFLSTLVDALCVVDDIDLIALFTSAYGGAFEGDTTRSRNVMAMRAFFVFEAKLTMLSRLAAAGTKAVMHLIDLKLIENLTGMKVFELQTYHHHQRQQIEMGSQAQGTFGGSRKTFATPMPRNDENNEGLWKVPQGQNQHWLQGIGFPTAASTPMESQQPYRQQSSSQQLLSNVGKATTTMKSSESNEIFNPSHHAISESLYTQVLKLFHVILDSAPKNMMAITQILGFLHVHDSTLSKLLISVTIGDRDHPRQHAVQMLTSLMCKLARNRQRIKNRTPIFSPKTKAMLKPGLLNILRMEAERNIVQAQGDEIVASLVKQVLLFLYYCSKKGDEDGENGGGKEQQGGPQINPVLENRFDLDTVMKDQNANVGLGVVMRCVVNAAQNIAQSQVNEKRKFPFVTASSKEVSTTPRHQNNQIPSSSGSLPSSYQHLNSPQTFLTDKMLKDSQDIIELGLTLIYSHVQLFIQEYQEEKRLKKGDRLASYQEIVRQHVESNLTRVIVEACKRIRHDDYIETILHAIRKTLMVSTTAEGR